MEEDNTTLENGQVEEITEANGNPKKSNMPIFIIGALLLIPIIFIVIMLTGKDKTNDPATTTTAAPTEQKAVTPEEQLVTAMKTIQTDSSEKALFNLGLAYISNKMHKEGIEAYLKVLKMNPKHTIANSNLGFAYGCIGDWDNGIKYTQIALELDPTFQLAKNNLNWMLDEKAKASKK